ncbi:hypothetical protein SAMN04487897_101128 [Paenibacillus sp. yr247]|nr:hypothetical protein SAMN04487897_101128 [Paenibacillus sp. yr247]
MKRSPIYLRFNYKLENLSTVIFRITIQEYFSQVKMAIHQLRQKHKKNLEENF